MLPFSLKSSTKSLEFLLPFIVLGIINNISPFLALYCPLPPVLDYVLLELLSRSEGAAAHQTQVLEPGGGQGGAPGEGVQVLHLVEDG